MQATITKKEIAGYEAIYEIVDEKSSLHAFVAIHKTIDGRALGGTRFHNYSSPDEALQDALRLSKAMTLKAAFAQIRIGGGKGVIFAKNGKTKELLHAYGEALEAIGGKFITGEDFGTTSDDIKTIKEKTNYTLGVSLDPAFYTSLGLIHALKATLFELKGDASLKNATIAIQGLGAVGMNLASLLQKEGTNLIVSDIKKENVEKAVRDFKATSCPPQDIHKVQCDIFSPCAMGGILNEKSIPEISAKAICGSANNQLFNEKAGELLFQKKILYAPDFVVNAGGLISVTFELSHTIEGMNEKIADIYTHLLKLFSESKRKKLPPEIVAIEMATSFLACP